MSKNRVWADVSFSSASGTVTRQAIVDTGATLSFVPHHLATELGLALGDLARPIRWGNGRTEDVVSSIVEVSFPGLASAGRRIAVAITEVHADPIIGMDVMVPLGITIDTGTGKLKIANKLWEAAKAASAIVGAASFAKVTYDWIVDVFVPKKPAAKKPAAKKPAAKKPAAKKPAAKKPAAKKPAAKKPAAKKPAAKKPAAKKPAAKKRRTGRRAGAAEAPPPVYPKE